MRHLIDRVLELQESDDSIDEVEGDDIIETIPGDEELVE